MHYFYIIQFAYVLDKGHMCLEGFEESRACTARILFTKFPILFVFGGKKPIHSREFLFSICIDLVQI